MRKILLLLILALLFLSACTNPYKEFVNILEQETKDENLTWDTIFQVTHEYDTDNFNYILAQNEFHSIDELKSFGIANEDGMSIIFLNESIESGKDGSIADEKNLYIIKGVGDETFKIPVKEEDLLNLEKAINTYVDKIYLENHIYDGPENYKFNDIENTSFDNLIKEYINRD